MNPTDTLRIFIDALTTIAYVGGPILGAALVAGIIVGLVQTVAQVNEASISFLVKVVAVVAVMVTAGSALSTHLVGFTRRCLESVEHVVK